MIDIKVKYQAVALMPGIEVNQSNISQMMEVFADKGLIPTTFPESSQLRFMLQSTNNEWNIHFGIDRIEITKNATDTKGSNIGTIEQFCADVSGFFTKILNKYPQQASRLALLSSVILKEMSEDMLNGIYEKFFNPIPLYSENKPVEWNSMTVSHIQKEVNSVNEIINFISTINRLNGQLNINQEFIPIDRISVILDINTIPNAKNRFGETEIVYFYKNIPVWHNDLLNEILDKIR
jgi:hypothetical protein